jgi:hypothetical protein
MTAVGFGDDGATDGQGGSGNAWTGAVETGLRPPTCSGPQWFYEP